MRENPSSCGHFQSLRPSALRATEPGRHWWWLRRHGGTHREFMLRSWRLRCRAPVAACMPSLDPGVDEVADLHLPCPTRITSANDMITYGR
jgi:hypothetical protein